MKERNSQDNHRILTGLSTGYSQGGGCKVAHKKAGNIKKGEKARCKVAQKKAGNIKSGEKGWGFLPPGVRGRVFFVRDKVFGVRFSGEFRLDRTWADFPEGTQVLERAPQVSFARFYCAPKLFGIKVGDEVEVTSFFKDDFRKKFLYVKKV